MTHITVNGLIELYYFSISYSVSKYVAIYDYLEHTDLNKKFIYSYELFLVTYA